MVIKLKSMVLVCTLLFLQSLLVADVQADEPNFELIFGRDYKSGVALLQRLESDFAEIALEYQADAAVMMAVAFPETVRYSILRDFFETAFLEATYKESGNKYVDFSIGQFQMKPSFAGEIERELATGLYGSKLQTAFGYNSDDVYSVRAQRLHRLKNTRWQIRYLAAFYKIVTARSDWPHSLSATENIRLMAAAYNSSFRHEVERLQEIAVLPYFPYGRGITLGQYPYADVAVFFYRNSLPTIINQ